ncbi:MAG: hypothetical protein EXR60_05540 [Dehalococcoidia bacterium]|nr:hypothetical protein [Dehalococcoidia bacterium]
MKYVIFGRVLPERAGVWFTPQVWRSPAGDSITISCDASQLSINADLTSAGGYVDAFIMAEQVAQAVVSALGFALGTGYSVELLQVVTETGDPHTFGLRPGNLQFDQDRPVFLQAAELARKDVFFRLALRDYVQAIGQTMDCAHYCYRAIEAIKAAFEANAQGDGWPKMHETIGTTRDEIDAAVKNYADPARHGNWAAFKSTTAAERNKMLEFTRGILARYLKWKLPDNGIAPTR